ncbi:o-succinylbenzoate synthase [Listeria booriae]|nr:o-succinylbenzoate synthase [Listeria booriae]MBC1335213.1 o-succinylbenzoate synthase [Listeria booriae]
MLIKKAEIFHLQMPLVAPFKTSYGEMSIKHLCIVKLVSEDGIEGYGELDAFEVPWYTEETTETASLIIRSHLLPQLKGVDLQNPNQVNTLFKVFRGNEMAKAAVETAIWDMFAKASNQPLATFLGGSIGDIDVGVSIGIQESPEILVNVVRKYVSEGYSRVKLKIKPGSDVESVQQVRATFPNLSLMVDANSGYTRADIETLKKLDKYDLAMIEQPFGTTDFVDHTWLQQQIATPVCLDENIRSLADAKQAFTLKSAKAINLKIARVGGLSEAIAIAEFCFENNMLVWCGGMYEAGIGRAHNIALASRAEFTFPGDISASNRYFHQDIVQNEITINNGKIATPTNIGIGVTVDQPVLESYCTKREVIVLD